MYVYHRTDAAAQILSEGFRDIAYVDNAGDLLIGVWVSMDPPGPGERAGHVELLTSQIPREVFDRFELSPDEGGYGGAVVPAEVLNRYGRATLVTDEDSFSPRIEGTLILPEFQDVAGSTAAVTRSRSRSA